jgi:transposase-like protein
MAKELDGEPEAWRSRRLEKTYPYLAADTLYEYVREDGQVESDGVVLVKAVGEDGYREILSVFVAPTEEEATWNEVFSDLLARGMDAQAVRCLTSDEHKGLGKAMRRYLQKPPGTASKHTTREMLQARCPRKLERKSMLG